MDFLNRIAPELAAAFLVTSAFIIGLFVASLITYCFPEQVTESWQDLSVDATSTPTANVSHQSPPSSADSKQAEL